MMNKKEKSYKIKERAIEYVKKCGSVKKAIKQLKIEYKEMQNNWSKYSCDCLGHAIICTLLLIGWLERGEYDNVKND